MGQITTNHNFLPNVFRVIIISNFETDKELRKNYSQFKLIIMIFSIIISSLTLIFSIFSFIFFTRKNLEVNNKLSELQINKLKREEDELKQAKINIRSNKIGDGKLEIDIVNEGKCDARNVKINVINEDGKNTLKKYDDNYPILEPERGISNSVWLNKQWPFNFTLEITWEDDFQKDNKLTRTFNT